MNKKFSVLLLGASLLTLSACSNQKEKKTSETTKEKLIR